MKETVDKILKQEEESRQRIEHARQESQDLIRKAQEEASSLIERSITGSHTAAQARKEEADKGFTLEKEKELKAALDKISVKRLEKEKDITALSRKIFQEIIQIKV
jgi:vacuolar-type H+-ATPase subunit H